LANAGGDANVGRNECGYARRPVWPRAQADDHRSGTRSIEFMRTGVQVYESLRRERCARVQCNSRLNGARAMTRATVTSPTGTGSSPPSRRSAPGSGIMDAEREAQRAAVPM
jgi:hypothetical protein